MTARATTAIENNGGSGLCVDDLAIDHEIAQLSSGVRFLLEVTPLNVDVARAASRHSGPALWPGPQLTISGRRPELSSKAAVEACAVCTAGPPGGSATSRITVVRAAESRA